MLHLMYFWWTKVFIQAERGLGVGPTFPKSWTGYPRREGRGTDQEVRLKDQGVRLGPGSPIVSVSEKDQNDRCLPQLLSLIVTLLIFPKRL